MLNFIWRLFHETGGFWRTFKNSLKQSTNKAGEKQDDVHILNMGENISFNLIS